MKPTSQQVADFFELGTEAVGSREIRDSIQGVPLAVWRSSDVDYLMGSVEWAFEYLHGCPITKYFKPTGLSQDSSNDGEDE